jgi:hypothetical protein
VLAERAPAHLFVVYPRDADDPRLQPLERRRGKRARYTTICRRLIERARELGKLIEQSQFLRYASREVTWPFIESCALVTASRVCAAWVRCNIACDSGKLAALSFPSDSLEIGRPDPEPRSTLPRPQAKGHPWPVGNGCPAVGSTDGRLVRYLDLRSGPRTTSTSSQRF